MTNRQLAAELRRLERLTVKTLKLQGLPISKRLAESPGGLDVALADAEKTIDKALRAKQKAAQPQPADGQPAPVA